MTYIETHPLTYHPEISEAFWRDPGAFTWLRSRETGRPILFVAFPLEPTEADPVRFDRLPVPVDPEAPDQRGYKDASGKQVWWWDGNREKPTVKESVHVPGMWHGYITAGEIQTVGWA